MNPTEERLQDLLHRAVPAGSPVSLQSVTQRVARRRRQRLSVVSAAAAVIGVVAAVTLVGTRTPGTRVLDGPTPRPTAGTRVPFQGVTFTLPEGWTAGRRAGCGLPPDHALVLEDRSTGTYNCPLTSLPTVATTSVVLSTLYGRQYALGWSGRPTRWHGQPAWTNHGPVSGGTSWTLVLPWLNTVVTAQAPDSRTARDLLDRVSWTARSGLDVPASASSVDVQSLAGHDGDGTVRSTTVTRAQDVRLLLDDLRALPVLPSSTPACGPALSTQTAVLTVPRADGGERSYLLRFAGCHQVISGTGVAAASSRALLDDLRRMLPTSGL